MIKKVFLNILVFNNIYNILMWSMWILLSVSYNDLKWSPDAPSVFNYNG